VSAARCDLCGAPGKQWTDHFWLCAWCRAAYLAALTGEEFEVQGFLWRAVAAAMEANP
jgi:hypothetical protein